MAKEYNERIDALGGIRIPSGAGAGLLASSDASGNISWAQPRSIWTTATSNRAATDILMSTYDTNPAATDHTAAFQAAFAAALSIITAGAAKVRIILDSRQKYQIGGAVTAGAHGEWSQIALPYASKTVARGSVQLVGIPRENDYSFYGRSSGTVIESTLASAPAYSAAQGIASIFGSTASYCTTHVSGSTAMNAIGFSTKDVTIRSASPVICGIDAGFLDSFAFDGLLQFDTDAMASGGALVVCTAPQAIPVIFPFIGSQRGTQGDLLVCSGWLGGPVIGELSRVRRIVVFCCAGASLNLDVATQVSHIGDLDEWNTAYGIASTAPSSATPISTSTTGPASGNTNAGRPSPIKIDNWTVQTTANAAGVPASTNRVYDVMDTQDAADIMCPSFNSTTDALVLTNAPIIWGFGGSLTGLAAHKRIHSAYSRTVPFVQALPGTGVAARNNVARDILAVITGGTVSSIVMNTVTVTSPFILPANGVYTITYTGSPTMTWMPS